MCIFVCGSVCVCKAPKVRSSRKKNEKQKTCGYLRVGSFFFGKLNETFPDELRKQNIANIFGVEAMMLFIRLIFSNLSVGQQTNANRSRGQMNCLSNIVGSINSQDQRSQRNLLINLFDSTMAVSISLWQLNGMLCQGMPSLWLILKRRNAFIQPVWCRRWNTHNFCFSWTSIAQHKQKHEVEAFLRRISFHLSVPLVGKEPIKKKRPTLETVV